MRVCWVDWLIAIGATLLIILLAQVISDMVVVHGLVITPW
jgi:hypothetical protein